MSDIFEGNKFLSRKAWIIIKIIKVKSKGRELVPVNWVFKIKEEHDGLIHLKLRNVVKGYMQVPGVDNTESFSLFATDMSTIILIGLASYHEEEGYISELCNTEAAFLHIDIPVEIIIQWP